MELRLGQQRGRRCPRAQGVGRRRRVATNQPLPELSHLLGLHPPKPGPTMTNVLPPPVDVGDYPIGAVVPSAAVLNEGALVSQGWLYCNGASGLRSTYATLFG